MGGRLEPQPFCFASLDDTQPDGPNFKPFCSIQSVMMIWAAHSRSCKSKAVQLWQKLALDYACQRICREKLKYVKIIRVHWEKRGRTPRCFMVVCNSILFSETQMDWTIILSRWSKRWEDGPGHDEKTVQDSGVSSSHFTCNHEWIIHIMKTNSPIWRDASVDKVAFYCHHNPALEIEVCVVFGTF